LPLVLLDVALKPALAQKNAVDVEKRPKRRATLYEQRFGVRVDSPDDRVFTKFVWSAVGHHWVVWDDPETQDVVVPGRTPPKPLDPPGQWTLNEIWALAARVQTEQPGIEEEAHFEAVLAEVYPSDGRQPKLIKSIVGKAVHAARHRHR
jgi:hypothetical protein